MSGPVVLTGEIVDPLTDVEYADLERLETTIERGKMAFFEVGAALAEIKERRLYRQYHSSFDAYCRDQWEMAKTKAYDLIRAARVVDELSGIPDTPTLANAEQARGLSSLAGDPEAAAAALREAAEDGPVTAAKIKAAADKRKPAPEPDDPGAALQREQQEERARAVAEKASKYVNDLLLLDSALVDLRTVGRLERWCSSVRETQAQ